MNTDNLKMEIRMKIACSASHCADARTEREKKMNVDHGLGWMSRV